LQGVFSSSSIVGLQLNNIVEQDNRKRFGADAVGDFAAVEVVEQRDRRCCAVRACGGLGLACVIAGGAASRCPFVLP
jgi:hypothetical protein